MSDELEMLRSQADLYRRGYAAMQAADISEYLALCGMVRQYERALDDIEQTGHNPAHMACDLIGKGEAGLWELVNRLASMAMRGLHGTYPGGE